MIKQFHEWLAEANFADVHPKNKYIELSPDEREEWAETLVDLIANAYSHIGGNPEFDTKKSLLKSDITYWLASDIDVDPEIDVVLGGKPTKAGNKMTVLGQDGSNLAKKVAIMKMIDLVKTRGFYAELDPDLANKMGMTPIKDEKIIRKVLDKDVTMNADGSYSRMLTGLGKVKTKVLVGMPKV